MPAAGGVDGMDGMDGMEGSPAPATVTSAVKASNSPGMMTPDSWTHIRTPTGTLAHCHDVTSLRQHNINNHPNVNCKLHVQVSVDNR